MKKALSMVFIKWTPGRQKELCEAISKASTSVLLSSFGAMMNPEDYHIGEETSRIFKDVEPHSAFNYWLASGRPIESKIIDSIKEIETLEEFFKENNIKTWYETSPRVLVTEPIFEDDYFRAIATLEQKHGLF